MKPDLKIVCCATLVATTCALASAIMAETPVQSFVEAPGPAGPLRGTMLSPATAGAPVVLIIPGSGPTDRDGNGDLLQTATYRLLAEGLAARGIASVRIDKRGMFGSSGAIPDANAVTIDDYAADVGFWTSAIRQQTGAACIWLLGHSKGGLVALAAARTVTDVCGLLLVATAGRPLGEVLREQLLENRTTAPIFDEAIAAIDKLEAGKHVDVGDFNSGLMSLFAPQVQNFLINAFAYDPVKLIATVDKPILIVQGERDLQVGVADAKRLKAAAPSAKLVLLADTNHVLKTVDSDHRSQNFATYSDPKLPLAPGVVDNVADFVIAKTKAP